MKKLLLTLSLAILGCASPVQLIQGTPTPTLPPTETPAPTQTPLPTAEPGTEQNPLILALGPSPTPSEDMVSAGNVIAAFLEAFWSSSVSIPAPVRLGVGVGMWVVVALWLGLAGRVRAPR